MGKIKIILISLFWTLSSIYSYSLPRNANDCVTGYSLTFVGAREKGGNNVNFDDPILKSMLSKAGWKKTQPWCSFFVKGILDHCAVAHSITGWSPTSFNENDIIYTDNEFVNTYSEDDVMVMSLSYDKFKNVRSRFKGIGHTGIVLSIGQHSVTTIEGNTNEAGTRDSRSGDGVCKKKRPLNSRIHITRWKKSKNG